MRIQDLESSLQQFINQSFENITSIEQSLSLLKKFQTILQRESLKNDLDSKFTVIFHNYGLDLTTVQEIYEKFKHNPPIPRNMPPVAGNIMWSRHLLKRIEEPMRKFESNPTVLATKDSVKIIKTYNKVARTLVAFEYLWYEAWCRSVETAKAGLQATLIIRHPDNNRLYVNFDPEILQLIREAKCLSRMGIDIPESAKIVLLQEDKFKSYFNELSYALKEYERVMGRMIPVVSDLLRPHVSDLEFKLRPGMLTLTWTSMNIDAYKHHIHIGLQKLEQLIGNINDIIENRIEKNLKTVTKTLLVDLPVDASFALDEFVSTQERHVRDQVLGMEAKNLEVETAVDNLIDLVTSYPLDSNLQRIGEDQIANVQAHYNRMMYTALLNSTKASLTALKKRICGRGVAATLSQAMTMEKPFFEVDVQLAVPSVRLSPGLNDIQRAVNKGAIAVLRVSKQVPDWGQRNATDEEKIMFFEKIGCDVQIVKVCLLLTGALHGTKNQVHDYLSTFKKYDWLWKEDMDMEYQKFMAINPKIEDFDAELKKFMAVELTIADIPSVHNIGALALNTKNIKLQLRNECRQWKVQYTNKVHDNAKTMLEDLQEYIQSTTKKLGRTVDSLDSLRFVMNVLKEVRERESSIEMEINPILNMYDLLEHYLPGGHMDAEEMDQKSTIRATWRKLVDFAEDVTDDLSEIQGDFRRKLIRDVREFQVDVMQFRNRYQGGGPTVAGIKPLEAITRLKRFRGEFELYARKEETYGAGEDLFAMRKTNYPELTKTRKELGMLDQLYTLYADVAGAMDDYRSVVWTDVVDNIESMTERVEGFSMRCKKMPKSLRDWKAYQDLKDQITAFEEVLPLLQELSKDSVQKRHWEEVMEITGASFPIESMDNEFKLKLVLDAHLNEYAADIEEICDGADKQLGIEVKLADIKQRWVTEAFAFGEWRNRKCPVLRGFGAIIEELEESQLNLQTMLSMRHVTPFRAAVQGELTTLSDTGDTLELWIKVQMMWQNLESVFTGGDIMKQMPLEAKKFAKIDKDFNKIMVKASETRNCVVCCANELLRNTLPVLYAELEKCQKSLDGYLEQKRNKFPRFFFVSSTVLLQILSQGSDPLAVQPFYEKVFDAIDKVVHDPKDVTIIREVKSSLKGSEEVIRLSREVAAKGNIEDWLGHLETEMQKTMKDLCANAAVDCSSMSLREFVDKTCAQFTLLGIQFNWTSDCHEALSKCRQVKNIMKETEKKQLLVLDELSSWCLTDLGSKMNRVKVETLVTIQVHQRDVLGDLGKLYKERKIQDTQDFEWLKQARFEWRPDDNDRHGDGACVISVCDVDFKYCYEYLGVKDRLVITPLTDRCYITLAQALGMHLGGAPAGPAGTGKTETVKDLGRTLGIFVVVTNCTDQQRFTDMAKIFKGLCQAGLWGCFDEFNRIELPVLSVVAQQVLAITTAKRTSSKNFTFPGDPQVVSLNPVVGYFITMNPGYAGRQELPENLKVLFRGVTMMVPDREIIMKVKLCSVGFKTFTNLSKKFRALYKLSEEQLSKQKHYDFGLRNILSVLRTAGQTKRDNLDKPEDMLLMRTLRDMNLSKLVAEDTPLFLFLLLDLFPRRRRQGAGADNDEILDAIQEVVKKDKLVYYDPWVLKNIQLYDTTLVRHGIMLVGPAGSDKTTIHNTLRRALSSTTGIKHNSVRMNPKAIRAEQMFGETEKASGEWLEGVFAAIWAVFSDRARKDINWIVCDGPVDAIWIENLNTVLDDNRILTLANGDRIPMTDNTKIMFEVENLSNASPATVSRAGIIYVSDSDLDWGPLVESWLKNGCEATYAETLKTLFAQYVGENHQKEIGVVFRVLSRECNIVMKQQRVGMIAGMLTLLTELLHRAELSESSRDLGPELERVFPLRPRVEHGRPVRARGPGQVRRLSPLVRGRRRHGGDAAVRGRAYHLRALHNVGDAGVGQVGDARVGVPRRRGARLRQPPRLRPPWTRRARCSSSTTCSVCPVLQVLDGIKEVAARARAGPRRRCQ